MRLSFRDIRQTLHMTCRRQYSRQTIRAARVLHTNFSVLMLPDPPPLKQSETDVRRHSRKEASAAELRGEAVHHCTGSMEPGPRYRDETRPVRRDTVSAGAAVSVAGAVAKPSSWRQFMSGRKRLSQYPLNAGDRFQFPLASRSQWKWSFSIALFLLPLISIIPSFFFLHPPYCLQLLFLISNSPSSLESLSSIFFLLSPLLLLLSLSSSSPSPPPPCRRWPAVVAHSPAPQPDPPRPTSGSVPRGYCVCGGAACVRCVAWRRDGNRPRGAAAAAVVTQPASRSAPLGRS